MFWRINQNGSYLKHEGIKGQKWGVRNGPPYPLGYSKHSSSEKAKNPKTKIDGDPETGTKKSRNGLTDGQKRAIKIGAIVAGTALVAIGGYELYKHRDEIRDLVGKGSKLIGTSNPNIDGFKEPIASSKIIKNAVERNKALREAGSDNHCTNIWMQMECSERGISCLAMSRENFGNKGRKIDEVLDAFKYASLHFDERVRTPSSSTIDSSDKLKDYLINKMKVPSDSRGFISGNIQQSDGTIVDHAFQWKLTNGELSVNDGAHGENAYAYLKHLVDYVDEKGQKQTSGIFRSDDLIIDEEKVFKYFVDKQ